MDKSPNTEKSIGIITHNHDYEGFSGVRHKAKVDWEDRHIKSKRNRQIPAPQHKIDEEIVIAKGYKERDYMLVKIIDFEEESRSFKYYGIVLKVTDKKELDRVGRLVCTGGHWFGYYPANVTPEKIKWSEENNSGKISK